MKVLMIDIGGSNVKMMVTGNREMRKFRSGRELTAVGDWDFERISIGFPGLVRDGRLVREPLNLSGGWRRFDLERAFDRPVRIINDAALHALANYRKGRMLFVGFGTSVGAALVADGVIVPIELGLIPFSRKNTFMSRLTKEARRVNGHERWQKNVHAAIFLLQDIFWPADTVIGGGNAKVLDPLPPKCRRTSNLAGIMGAARLWEGADMYAEPCGTIWKIHDGSPSGRDRRSSEA
jgi:polyphosphate glucokinase